MSITKKQKAAIKALVSCHETGKATGNYSAIVVLADDAGISYGSHMATHKSGSLYKVVKLYCDTSSSATAKALIPYLAGLNNPALRHTYAKDVKLKNLLVKAGSEPEMQQAQEVVFDVNYMIPSIKAFEGSGWVHPLSLAVIYDSMIQGGWATVRNKVKAAPEKTWIKNYVAARRNWLANSSKPVVRKTVYRMTTFENLFKADNWSLSVPFSAHGVKITDAHLKVWEAADLSADIEKDEKIEEILEPTIEEITEIEDYLNSNTEGIAEEITEEQETDNNHSAENDEVILPGGGPKDPPTIVDKKEPEKTGGWHTWKTTVSGVAGSITASGASLWAWFSGAISDPSSAQFILAVGAALLVIAFIFGIVYLIIRAIDKARRENQAHEITMMEMELKASPDKFNVKVDRRLVTR